MAEIEIFEVGPRDGLQNETRHIPTSEKIALVDLLSEAGFQRIECASFVSPKWVPQMADSAEVMQGITRKHGLRYAALTPNVTGFDRALAAGADEVAIFASASEAFSKANLNADIETSLMKFAEVAKAAQAQGVLVRGYVSMAVACPYSGPVAPAEVARVAARLLSMGCYEISLGDTTGAGVPETIGPMLDAVLDAVPDAQLAGHYHDTGGRALDNIAVSIERGVRVFDAAVGGLGGCPYSPGATGNVATEAVMAYLDEQGHTHGLDKTVITRAAAFAQAMRSGTVQEMHDV